MNYIQLNNEIKMPILGLGTYGLNGESGKEIIQKALKQGYRLIDTARMYNNEEIVGLAIKESAIHREDIFLTTKLCQSSHSYEQAKKDIDDSLKRLQVDYVDLLLIHEPYIQSFEMYEAIKEAYIKGKARAIGVSNFNDKCYKEFIQKCGIIPAINQIESHIYFTQHELQRECEMQGTKIQAWSPLANGKTKLLNEPLLNAIANRYHKTVAQVALRYLIQKGIAVIPKTKDEQRLIENSDIFDFELTKEEVKEIGKLDQKKSMTGWYRSYWF